MTETARGVKGAIAGVDYHLSWCDDWVRLAMVYPIMPAVRQTQRSKYVNPRAKIYNSQQAALRDRIILIMRQEGINGFHPGAHLSMEAKIWRKRKDGDIDNLLKTLADLCQGALYEDDRCIRQASVTVLNGETEGFEVEFRVMKSTHILEREANAAP